MLARDRVASVITFDALRAESFARLSLSLAVRQVRCRPIKVREPDIPTLLLAILRLIHGRRNEAGNEARGGGEVTIGRFHWRFNPRAYRGDRRQQLRSGKIAVSDTVRVDLFE